MAMHLKESWKAEKREQIKRYLQMRKANGPVEHITLVTSILPAIRWMILELTESDIPYRLVQLGAGVRKLTTDTTICPKCGGTGHVLKGGTYGG